MGRPVLTDGQAGFIGGNNTDIDPSVLLPNQVRSTENFRINDRGTASKRGGTQRMHSSAFGGTIQGGYGWMRPGGAKHVVVANGEVNLADIASAPLSFTALSGAIDTTEVVDMASFRDGSGEVVYIADGGPLNKCTTTTLTANLADTPNVTSLAVYNSRLYAVDGVTQNLYASPINNGDSLGVPARNGIVAIIKTFSDQELFAVRSLKSSLAIFHRSGISRLTGLTIDDIDIAASTQGFSDEVGTISKKSLVQVEDTVFFFSENGFYKLTDTGLEWVSPTLRDMVRGLDPSTFYNIHGAHDKLRNEVRWSLPGVGVYVYNYTARCWSGPWKGPYLSVSSMWSTEAEDDVPSQVFIGSADGYMRLNDATAATDEVLSDGTGGTRVAGSVAFRRYFFGDETVEKSLRWVYIHANLRGSITAYARWRTKYNIGTGSFDFAQDTPESVWGIGTWGSGTWGGSRGAETYTAQGDGRGYYFDLTFYDDGPGQTQLSRIQLKAFDMTQR